MIAATAAVQADWLRACARALGGDVVERRGAQMAIEPGGAALLFPETPDGLAELVELCDERAVRSIGCWGDGVRERPEVERTLADLGFDEGWRPHWMVSRVAGFGPAGPDIEMPDDVPEFDEHGQALLTMIGDATRVFTARVGSRLAGFAWLHAPPGMPAAGMFDVVVFDGFRRRGLGSELTRAALAHAAALGREHVVLNATPDGERLYSALGFASLGGGRTWWRHRGC